MSKLSVKHKTFKALFEDKKSDFFIPATESEEQDTALQIFLTLNYRGLPLFDVDFLRHSLINSMGINGKYY